MNDIKVQTLVQNARDSGNRVDKDEAKDILAKIKDDKVTPTELDDAMALVTRARAEARSYQLLRYDMGKDASSLRREDKYDEAGRMIDHADEWLKNATEFRDFAEGLYLNLDAAYQAQSVRGRVSQVFSQAWDSYWK